MTADPVTTRLRSGAGLSEAGCAAIAGLIRQPYDVAPRGRLVAESSAAALLVLLDGWACRHKYLQNGARQITELYLPGDVIPTVSAGTGYSLEALSACVLAPVRAIDLGRDRSAPDIGHGLRWSARQGEAILREGLVNIARRRGPERVAHLLCEVRARLGMAGAIAANSARIGWPLTQTDVGDALGLSGVHVNRSLAELRELKLAHVHLRAAIITNATRLAEYCEFDPAYLRPAMGDAVEPRP